MQRWTIKALVCTTVACAGALIIAATPVSAAEPPAYTSCSDLRQTKSVVGPDVYRARTDCSSIQNGYKERAKLVRSGGLDYTSVWFTELNAYYYTGWYTCVAGCYATHEGAPL